MGSVPTSLGEWIHSPWFDLGLVVWKGYRPRVRLVLAGGHASAWISPFWRGPAPGAQRYQAMQWLTDAWNICARLRSAGIQIDEHHCWKTSGIHMHAANSGLIDQYPLLAWTGRLPGYATLRKALLTRAGSATTTILCRANLFVCLTPIEVDRLLAGERVAAVDPLFLIPCGCSNKCSILVNHHASLPNHAKCYGTCKLGRPSDHGQNYSVGTILVW
jgi:hypothetical protein